jgi:hypothetical protein
MASNLIVVPAFSAVSQFLADHKKAVNAGLSMYRRLDAEIGVY